MSLNYNQERILDFLRERIEENLPEFINRFRMKAEHDIENNLPYLGAVQGVSNFYPQALNLIEDLKGKGHLHILPLYLIEYWQGAAADLVDYDLPEQLCIAAQHLLAPLQPRELANRSFAELTKFDEDFAQQWETLPEGALSHVTSLGPIKSVAEVTQHLAECRKLLEDANQLIDNHRWVEARSVFLKLHELQPGYAAEQYTFIIPLEDQNVDITASLEQIDLLQRVIDAALDGFVYDDRLPWKVEFPYRSPRHQVRPNTSMVKLAEISATLDHEARANLDRLKEASERLFVDVFLYPSSPSEENMFELEDFFKEHARLPDIPELHSLYSDEAVALILILTGRETEASQLWAEQQRTRPRAGRVAHCQALLHLAQAYDARLSVNDQINHWEYAISQWAVAMVDEVYWLDWGQKRFQYYEQPFLHTPVRNIPDRLEQYLLTLLDERIQLLADDRDVTARFERLQQAVLVEFNTALLSNGLGGFRLKNGKRAWFGPLWMDHFGLQDDVASALARFQIDPLLTERLPEKFTQRFLSEPTPEALQRQMRWYFSELKWPTALLEMRERRPRRALEYLENLSPSQMVEDVDFALKNPAYAGLPNQIDQIKNDILHLCIESHLMIAAHQVAGDGGIQNMNILQNAWREALRLAEQCKEREIVETRILSFTLRLGRIPVDSDLNRLSHAITLHDLCRSVLREPQKNHRFNNHLAQLLAKRAMFRLQPGKYEWALVQEDLNRALNLAPHLTEVRKQYALSLFNQAGTIVFSDRLQALDLVRQAEEVIEEGNRLYPDDYSDVEKLLAETRKNLSPGNQSSQPLTPPPYASSGSAPPSLTASGAEISGTTQLYAQGIRQLHSDRPDAALQTFQQALQQDPDNATVQKGLSQTILTLAWAAVNTGNAEAGCDLLKHWIPQLPTQTDLPHQLEFLQGWHDLKNCLDDLDRTYRIDNYRQVRTPFEDVETPNRWGVISIHDGHYYLSTPLASFSSILTDAMIENIVRASSDIMLLKVRDRNGNSLDLETLIPVDMLTTTNQFEQILFMLYTYTNISTAQLAQLESTTRWFQERRTELLQIIDWDTEQKYLVSQLIETWCAERGLSCLEQTTDCYQIDEDNLALSVKTMPEGTQIAVNLGPLDDFPTYPNIFRKIIMLNAQPSMGKLAVKTVDDRDEIILSVELPYLNPETVSHIYDYLKTARSNFTNALKSTEPVN